MPMPLAHAAIGAAVYAAFPQSGVTTANWWKLALFICIVANLPDLDYLANFFLTGKAGNFHRGPTHSIYFAFLAGLAVYFAAQKAFGLSGATYLKCSAVILSHPAADALMDHIKYGKPLWAAIRPIFIPPLYRNSSTAPELWEIIREIVFKSAGEYRIILWSLAITVIVVVLRKLL